MRKDQQERVDMIGGTLTFVNVNAVIWAGNERYAETVENLSSGYQAIREASLSTVSGKTTGDTKAEADALDQAADAVLRLTNIVGAWAIGTKDKVLLENVRFVHSDVHRLRDAEALEKMQQLVTACELEMPRITGCMFGSADVAAARSAMDRYVGLAK